jgi:hypothetical protein
MMVLEKAATQDEFIPGTMGGAPYKCAALRCSALHGWLGDRGG